MKRKTLLTIASAICAVGVMSVAGYGCGDDDSAVTKPDAAISPETGPTPETGVPETGGGNPPVPTLGLQIDRMGRPAINTALNHVFDVDPAKGAAKDAYNQDTASAGWVAKYVPEFAGNLAILDALNDVCGDQAFANPDAQTNTTKVGRYGTFAGVGADDRLWIKMDAASCTTYLAVEANATHFLDNADCGGRGLAYDVIDVTYSLAAGGTPVAVDSVTDGIPAVAAKTSGTTFPYLAAPQ